MKRIFLILPILFICACACAPIHEHPLTNKQIVILQQSNALADWKATLADNAKCSSPPFVHLLSSALDNNWFDCCWQHDFDYRFGWKYEITKQQADYGLWQCVDASGHSVVANLMYDAVYLFGKSSYQKGY